MFELPRSLPRRIGLLLLALGMVGAGVNHFLTPEFYVRIMPPYLPLHLELVYLSGVFEILSGLAVLPVATRRFGGFFVIAVLVGVYPANIHMAMNPELFSDFSPATALYLRLPLQFVMMYWAYWATKP